MPFGRREGDDDARLRRIIREELEIERYGHYVRGGRRRRRWWLLLLGPFGLAVLAALWLGAFAAGFAAKAARDLQRWRAG
jgi:hypothetical protein